ncbi:MAG: MoaD/ThiS family protein [Candidatus Helarchaeota archaeon]
MSIDLIFESFLKNIFGISKLEYLGLNKNIREIVRYLFDYCKLNNREEELKSFVSNIDEFFTKVLILINDIDISALEEENTIINKGDTVIFIPITHGG